MEDIKLVCFDLDKTLISFGGQNSWYVMNVFLGVTPEEDQKLFDEYFQGKFTYREWMQKLVAIFQKSNKANLKDITQLLSGYEVHEDARKVVEHCKSKGYRVALISGSVDILVDLVSKDLGIELAEATNKIIFDKEDRLLDIVDLGDESIAKLNLLESYCRKLGIRMDQCACIGDGDNEIEIFRKTGKGVTFKGSKIETEAWKVVNTLSEVVSIL